MVNDSPFTDLPAALVQEVLALSQNIGGALLSSFHDLADKREERRHDLQNARLLHHESDLKYSTPTCCGVDGAFALERLLAVDFVAVAAVAVEGLTPPSETRYWPEPYHLVHIDHEPHDADTGTILRAMMAGMELTLAAQAPHDIVLLDGSLTTPFIFFNQALSKIATLNMNVSTQFGQAVKSYLRDYLTILEAKRSDKYWVSVPKYTTRREIGAYLNWPATYDDRAMLTDVLQPGEFTHPVGLEPPERPWHLNTSHVHPAEAEEVNKIVRQIITRLADIQVIYYRPNRSLPALRLEMSRSVAETSGRLANVIYGIKHQCSSPAILEPYPLYLADRMVKSLSTSISTFRQIITQSVSEHYSGDITDIFLNLHGYRTEFGG